jgi:hypothetical protein
MGTRPGAGCRAAGGGCYLLGGPVDPLDLLGGPVDPLDLLGGPVDPLDLQGIEAPTELDDETAGTLLLAGRPVDAGEGVVDLAGWPFSPTRPRT